MTDEKTNDSVRDDAAPNEGTAQSDVRVKGRFGERHVDGFNAKDAPLPYDHHEPRTGYRPELDERVERYGQYGMVIDAPPGDNTSSPPVGQLLDNRQPELPDEQQRLRDLERNAARPDAGPEFTEDLNELRTHRTGSTTTGQTQTVVAIDGTPVANGTREIPSTNPFTPSAPRE